MRSPFPTHSWGKADPSRPCNMFFSQCNPCQFALEAKESEMFNKLLYWSSHASAHVTPFRRRSGTLRSRRHKNERGTLETCSMYRCATITRERSLVSLDWLIHTSNTHMYAYCRRIYGVRLIVYRLIVVSLWGACRLHHQSVSYDDVRGPVLEAQSCIESKSDPRSLRWQQSPYCCTAPSLRRRRLFMFFGASREIRLFAQRASHHFSRSQQSRGGRENDHTHQAT